LTLSLLQTDFARVQSTTSSKSTSAKVPWTSKVTPNALRQIYTQLNQEITKKVEENNPSKIDLLYENHETDSIRSQKEESFPDDPVRTQTAKSSHTDYDDQPSKSKTLKTDTDLPQKTKCCTHAEFDQVQKPKQLVLDLKRFLEISEQHKPVKSVSCAAYTAYFY